MVLGVVTVIAGFIAIASPLGAGLGVSRHRRRSPW